MDGTLPSGTGGGGDAIKAWSQQWRARSTLSLCRRRRRRHAPVEHASFVKQAQRRRRRCLYAATRGGCGENMLSYMMHRLGGGKRLTDVWRAARHSEPYAGIWAFFMMKRRRRRRSAPRVCNKRMKLKDPVRSIYREILFSFSNNEHLYLHIPVDTYLH